jgi:hypothetical protein
MKKNQPEFVCSIEQFISSAENMTKAVNTTYKRFLSSNNDDSETKLNGAIFFGMANESQLSKIMADVIFRPFIIKKNEFKMFVINASSHNGIDPADGYHITFTDKYKHETAIFSQLYEDDKFYINIYSFQTGQLLEQFQNENVNEVWKLVNYFKKYLGDELFLLAHPDIKNAFEKTSAKFTTKRSLWNEYVFENLHLAYMEHMNSKEVTLSVLQFLKSRKSTLFELYNLLKNFSIIKKIYLNPDETIHRNIRAWRQLFIASGCKRLKKDNNKEVSQILILKRLIKTHINYFKFI